MEWKYIKNKNSYGIKFSLNDNLRSFVRAQVSSFYLVAVWMFAENSNLEVGTGLFFAKFFAKNRGVLGKTKKTKKTRKIGGYFSEKYWRGIFSWRKKRENLFFVVFGVEMRFITVFCTSMPTVSSLKQLNKPETDRQYREEEDNEHQNLRSLNQILLFI